MNLTKWSFCKIGVLFCTMFLFNSYGNTALAAEGTDYKKIYPGNIYVEENEAKINYGFHKENNSLDIKVDSRGLDKGYYTSNLYSKGNYNWNNFGMISFNLKNYSQGELKFNFSVVKKDGTYLSINEDKNILLKTDNQQVIEVLSPSYGTINIPAEFNGTIYIPFTSLKSDEFSQISSWGISVTTEENTEKNIVLSDFSLIPKSDSLISYGNMDFYIEGEDRVQIPVQGESIALYKTSVDNKKVNYKLAEDDEGVSINNEGRLTLNTSVKVEKIEIQAEYENLVVRKEIQLYKSWTLSAKEIDGTSKSIPSQEEVKNLIKGIYPLIMEERFINIIRIIFIVLVSIFLALYILRIRGKYSE